LKAPSLAGFAPLPEAFGGNSGVACEFESVRALAIATNAKQSEIVLAAMIQYGSDGCLRFFYIFILILIRIPPEVLVFILILILIHIHLLISYEMRIFGRKNITQSGVERREVTRRLCIGP